MDYTYVFPDLSDRHEVVKIIDHRSSREFKVNVCTNTDALVKTSYGHLTAMLADLVDLATAIFVADWLLPRKPHESLEIAVILPVRNPRELNTYCVLEELSQLLRWYTGDNWHFEFLTRKNGERRIELQRKLALSMGNSEVCLWSGGLDSLAGLYNRMLANTACQYTLLGTGSSSQIQGTQAGIAKALSNIRLQDILLVQVPIRLEYPSFHPLTNDLFRSRGFVFKLLGAVCALLEGQRVLHIYENGYGAINLPFTKAEPGLAHPRSMHPISLIETGNFVSNLVGTQFKFENPFLFSTKTQMCMSMLSCPDLAFNTITCDGRYRGSDQPQQCGYCSSCLLRRMALTTALGRDETPYVVTHGIVTQQLLQRRHFEAMDQQAIELDIIMKSDNPWQSLQKRYSDLRRLVTRTAKELKVERSLIQTRLLQLYQNHAEEWFRTREKLEF